MALSRDSKRLSSDSRGLSRDSMGLSRDSIGLSKDSIGSSTDSIGLFRNCIGLFTVATMVAHRLRRHHFWWSRDFRWLNQVRLSSSFEVLITRYFLNS